MARQFRTDDTTPWSYRFGQGAYDAVISSNETHTWNGTTRFQAMGPITGTAGQTSFVKPGGWSHQGLCLLHQTQGAGAGNWELSSVDFSGASAVADQPLQNSYGTGAQIITLSNDSVGYHDVTINGGVTLSVPAWNGSTGGILVILASGTVTIAGTIQGTGLGFRRGTAVGGQNQKGNQGEGTGGAGGQAVSANGNGGGGGEANGDGRGGAGGGNAAAGTNSSNSTGGSAVGAASLVTMNLGGGGGGGGQDDGSPDGNNHGGAGGAIVFIFAKTIPTITGSIILNGNAGVNANANYNGSGGGGAGGSCLLKGQTIDIGTNRIAVAAGSGGTGGSQGGAGSVGRIHADYSTSISGSTNPTIDSSLDLIFVDPIIPSGGDYTFFM